MSASRKPTIRSLRSPLAAVVLAIVLAVTGATVPANAQAASSTPATGTISGWVKGGRPATFLQTGYVALYPPDGSPPKYASTDAAGRYTFVGLSAGAYRVYFYGDGPDVGEWYSNQATMSDSTPVVVSAGATSTANATLGLPATISGRVTALRSNETLRNVDVVLYDRQLNPVSHVLTGVDGSYSLTGLSPGTYLMHFDGYGANDRSGYFLSQWWNNRESAAASGRITLGGGQQLSSRNARLAVYSSISGTVRAANGTGISGVSVAAISTSGSTVLNATTDATGAYTISGLVADTYKLAFSPPSGSNYIGEWYDNATEATARPVVLAASQNLTERNAVLANHASISGTLTTASGAPAADVAVMVLDSSGGVPGFTTSDAAGKYTVDGLDAGSYVLSFSGHGYLSQFYDRKSTFQTATRISVLAGQVVTGKNAVISTGGTVAGTVRGGDPATGLSVTVWLYSAGGDLLDQTTSGSDGTYSISGLQSGSYTLFIGGTGEYQPQWYDNRPDQQSANTFAVSEGATTTRNATLLKGGSISGTVTGPGGKALSGQQVTAYPTNATGDPVFAFTDASGNYRIGGLPADTYKVQFTTTGEFAMQWYRDATTQSSANPVVVPASTAVSGINASLVASAAAPAAG